MDCLRLLPRGRFGEASRHWRFRRALVRAWSASRSLGIPEDDVKDAAKQGEENAAKAKAQGKPIANEGNSGWLDRGFQDTVAFYACQADETTIELLRPPGPPFVEQNKYGLFSYHVITAMSQTDIGLTYDELLRKVATRYKLEPAWLEPPNPAVDAARNRRFLGLSRWPKRPSMTLSPGAGSLNVDAGELLGLTEGSILAVRKNGNPPTDGELLGYLKVKTLSPTQSTVEPTDYGFGQSRPTKLPERATCELAPTALATRSESWAPRR